LIKRLSGLLGCSSPSTNWTPFASVRSPATGAWSKNLLPNPERFLKGAA
jgi:hypothetical protein